MHSTKAISNSITQTAVVNTFSDPIVANVLPINEFITLDDGVQEYANSEDSPEIDFYFAAKRYIHDIDAGEAAWEARWVLVSLLSVSWLNVVI